MSGFAVLHRAEGYLAIDKPPGVNVIPGRDAERGPSVREQLEASLGARVFVVHRLDRDTSGVLLFALDAPTHRALSMAFEAGRVEKRYQALCQGALREERDVQVPLVPARRGRMRPGREGEAEAKAARTLIRPLEVFGDRATLVEAQPLSGRTHQIRVHLLALGHPLLFDHQYGQKAVVTERSLGVGPGDEVLLSRTPLHASSLRLGGIDGVEDAEIHAPLPADMARVLAALRR